MAHIWNEADLRKPLSTAQKKNYPLLKTLVPQPISCGSGLGTLTRVQRAPRLLVWQISGMMGLCVLVASLCQQGQGGAEGQFPVGSLHSPLHYLEQSPAAIQDLRQILSDLGQICVQPTADLGNNVSELAVVV